ncbi:ABC transporter permease [Ahrensia marina]|uniref:Transport permease protein n=1 Tax=Ahrensia marina TaxID=1514904 RepID=A0A0M9GMV3_9HYPH|nr:ABC transporter permease [Ahrensia marina]KPB01219.1 sugar ABC transporter permease [Ahrensia marina]
MNYLYKHRNLIYSLAKRELEARFRGSVLGLFWLVVMPILMLLVYSFVFGVIFKARWGIDGGDGNQYSLILFAGLIVFNIFAECISRAPVLITGNVNYVKKIVFPLEVLPLTILIVALFQAAISLLVWLVAHFIIFGMPPISGIMLPIVLLPYLLVVLGLSWFLASLGVFLRDVSQVIAIVVTVLLFMSPIFYPVSVVPERFRLLYMLNPVTTAVEMARDVLFFGRLPDPIAFGLFTLVSIIVAWLGFYWFQKTRKGFADVL